MFGYLFQLDATTEGLAFRRFLDISFALGKTYQDYEIARAAAKRIGVEVDSSRMQELASILMLGKMSERFSSFGGTYVIKTEEESNPEELIRFLDAKWHAGELTEFLKEARV